ncbi:hypothetical protein V501_04796 [Pseudogymnoascus sp. VKM F-4519 (FW-2642)]|nr:hypothetical protein V501_04796 [Pseudogymnoascus sp. VKM F-4519 (FW-2642)]
MISPFGSRGADRSAMLSAGTETPLMRPLKLQHPSHQNDSEFDAYVWLAGEPLIIEDNGDDESDDKAKAETTGRDQIHQGVKKAIVDEMKPSPLRKRAGGSCDHRQHSVNPHQKENENNDNEDSEDDEDEDGFIKCVRIGREATYNVEFRLLDLPNSFKPSIGLHISNSTSSGEPVGGSAHSRVCASHAKKSGPALQKQRKRPPFRERIVSRPGRHSTNSEDDDELLIQLKEDDKLPWDEIAEFFPTSNALPSTPFVAATADSTKGAHRSILSTGNKERTAVQPLCSSQRVESDTDEICEVEALLAKSAVRNVVWYLVKWEGYRDDENTWQEQDDISSDLVDNFEASYQASKHLHRR